MAPLSHTCIVLVAVASALLGAALLVSLRIARRDGRAARALLDEVIDSMAGGFVLWDADDRLMICNQAFRDTYPLCTEVLVPGNSFETIMRYGVEHGQYPQAEGRGEEFVREMLVGHKRGSQTVERLLPGGRWLLIQEQRTASGNILAIRSDITAFKRALAEAAAARDVVQHMAHHDALTGLPNRVLFRERLDAALAARGAGSLDVAVLYLDLDRFKAVNDSLGHGPGDELLAVVAARLRGEIRPSDTVARLGGDEFAILMVGGDVRAEAEAVAGRVIVKIGRPYRLAAGQAEVGVSVGASLCDSEGVTADELLRRADEALYAAKRAGRGTYRCDHGARDDRLAA